MSRAPSPHHSIQHRLRQWGQWRQRPREELTPSHSSFNRITEMGNNAGAPASGDGVIYQIVDGVACAPDGGLSEVVARRARLITHSIRCRETDSAIANLKPAMRRIVIETYLVPPLEKPRSSRLVAERLGVSQSTVAQSLKGAYKRLSRAIYGPFEVLEDEAEAETKKEATGRGEASDGVQPVANL